MAILRGGRRIGNYDIRIGFPRDRSLDNVEGDPRLKRAPGGGRESTINRFIANINQGEGLARPNRYLVVFNPPEKYKLGAVGTKQTEFGPPPYRRFEQYNQMEMKRNVGMMANKVTMPSRDINTTAFQTYGPAREMPYSYSFPGNIEMTFYGDKFLRQRVFFEEWQKLIYDLGSHNMNFYDDYIGTVDILQLGAFESNDDRDRVTYMVRLYECYPQTIGSYSYEYGSNDQIVKLPITLNYRNWRNLGIDQVNNFTVGKSFGELPDIKPAPGFGGLLGGVLNRLPPELKRAGRQVIDTARRNLPIGRATGGRVFPPFI